MTRHLQFGDITVDVLHKDIKNVHLSVHPPSGRVRISAPQHMTMDTIRVFAISKLGWIKQQQVKLRGQNRESPREFLEHESHYVWGRRYLMKIVEAAGQPSIELEHNRMYLRLRPGTGRDKTQEVVEAWYREQVKQAVPPLIAKWEPVLGVKVSRTFVQRMKTKWGSCTPETRSIRLNTELAKKPPECLEYIVVHEMAHLVTRRHDDRFTGLVHGCLPHWRLIRQTLNEAPLSHFDWSY